MSLQNAIRAMLLANADVAALVGDRVRPVIGAQEDPKPFLTIQISNNQGTQTHSGPAGSRNATAEIAIVSETYRDAEALALLIDRIVNGYVGVVPDQHIRIAPATLDDESDIEQSTPEGWSQPAYVKTLAYRCRYVLLSS